MLNALKENWAFVAGWIIIMIVFALVQSIYQQKINHYVENLNVRFSGVILKETRVERQKLFFIDVTTANPTFYDVRETEDVYFCVIKDDKAEFILDASTYQLEVGDSISVIPNPIRLINYTKKRIDEIKISGMFSSSVYKKARRKHDL